jgi:hypothetical protein
MFSCLKCFIFAVTGDIMPGKTAAKRKIYDFSGKDPKAVLTEDELEHFDEGMSLKNNSIPANQINMKAAVQSVKKDLDRLFP